jgi:V-type H+-transporting ATPase subunit H
MLVKASDENIIPMLGLRILPAVQTLSLRKWADEEIRQDMDFIVQELNAHVDTLT